MGKLDTEDDADDILLEDDSAIIKLVNKVIMHGYKKGCSDIHIEPYPGKLGVEIRFRIDGNCRKYQAVLYHYKRVVSSRIKEHV